jgi:hypothetical protein
MVVEIVETHTEFVQLDTTELLNMLDHNDHDTNRNPHGPTIEFLHTIDMIQRAKEQLAAAWHEMKMWTTGRNKLLPDTRMDTRSNSHEVLLSTQPNERRPVRGSMQLFLIEFHY